jgi:hypothetical protein
VCQLRLPRRASRNVAHESAVSSPAVGGYRQRNFKLLGCGLRARVKVRDRVSHPLRRNSGRSSNRKRHLSPSVITSRLIGTNPVSVSALAIWHMLSEETGRSLEFGDRLENSALSDFIFRD